MQTTFTQINIIIKRNDSGALSRFIFAYIFVLLFITSYTTTRQINNSCSLQINTSNGIARLRKMVHLSFENYTLPILRPFDVFKLDRFGFDTEGKEISSLKIFREIKQMFLQGEYT
jgi:hypothetical protein